MGKWVLGLCVSLYAVLILFGGEGYNGDSYAEAEPVEGASELQVMRTSAIDASTTEAAVEPTPVVVEEAPVLAETTEAELITPIQTAALEEKLETIATQIEETDLRPTLVLQPSNSVVASSANVIEPVVEPVAETPVASGPVGEIWTVTGNRVNLRAGASTANAVLGRTVRGDSAEIIEMLENGWAKVYILESGLEAYMSADFLSPNQL